MSRRKPTKAVTEAMDALADDVHSAHQEIDRVITSNEELRVLLAEARQELARLQAALPSAWDRQHAVNLAREFQRGAGDTRDRLQAAELLMAFARLPKKDS